MWLKIDGVDYNAGFYKDKSFGIFVTNEKHRGLSEKQMLAVFELINPPTNANDNKPAQALKSTEGKTAD